MSASSGFVAPQHACSVKSVQAVTSPFLIFTFIHACIALLASLLECMQAVKENHAGLTGSLMVRVNISRAIVQVLLEGPLHRNNSPSLHRQAQGVLNQLHMLQNFLDG